MGMGIKTLLFLISLVVTVAIFVWIFASIDLKQVSDLVYKADGAAILAFLLASLATSFFRAWRYSVLLGAVGYQPKRLSLYLVTLVRNLFSDLLPARIGTLMYVYLVTNRLGVPLAAASSSFSLAFIFDFIAIAPLLLIATLTLAPGGAISFGWLLAGSLIFGALSLLALFALPWSLKFIREFLQKRSQSDSADGFLGRAITGLRHIEKAVIESIKAKVYFQTLCLSVLVRLGKYSTLYLLLYAMLKPLGYSVVSLPPAKVFLGLVSAELAASLPIAGPAGLGAYQGAWAFTFALLGYEQSIAKATSVSHHLFTQAYGYSLGTLAMLLLCLPFFKVTEAPAGPCQRVSNLRFLSNVLGATFLIVVIVGAALQF